MKRILSCFCASLFFFACPTKENEDPINDLSVEEPSSSSVEIVTDNCAFTDSRDDQEYKCVTIGNQTWMASNLNYAGENGDIGNLERTNYSLPPATTYSAAYGRLYTWEEAKPICPAGWHLPSIGEWEELIDFVGKEVAGKKLKAKADDWNGTDDYGFSALPGGKNPHMQNWTCNAPEGAVCSPPYPDGNAGESGWWWTSTSSLAAVFPPEVLSVNMQSRRDNASVQNYDGSFSMSVRCVRD